MYQFLPSSVFLVNYLQSGRSGAFDPFQVSYFKKKISDLLQGIFLPGCLNYFKTSFYQTVFLPDIFLPDKFCYFKTSFYQIVCCFKTSFYQAVCYFKTSFYQIVCSSRHLSTRQFFTSRHLSTGQFYFKTFIYQTVFTLFLNTKNIIL